MAMKLNRKAFNHAKELIDDGKFVFDERDAWSEHIPSGGQISQIELRDFLARGYGPEQQALLQMIGTLIESAPGELSTGEGNPGLAVTGGSGHA